MRDWISMHVGFREHQRSAFFDDRVCHPNAEYYKDLRPQQIYRMHETKRHLYSRRVLDIEHGSFTPLVFTKTGGKGESGELIAIKIGSTVPNLCHVIRTIKIYTHLFQRLLGLLGQKEQFNVTLRALTSRLKTIGCKTRFYSF